MTNFELAYLIHGSPYNQTPPKCNVIYEWSRTPKNTCLYSKCTNRKCIIPYCPQELLSVQDLEGTAQRQEGSAKTVQKKHRYLYDFLFVTISREEMGLDFREWEFLVFLILAIAIVTDREDEGNDGGMTALDDLEWE